jgi:hypothetical protein
LGKADSYSVWGPFWSFHLLAGPPPTQSGIFRPTALVTLLRNMLKRTALSRL